jgi:hypothetical protein
MTLLATLLDHLDAAPATSFANLAMIPLLRQDARRPSYATLDEALATGRFRITEVSDMGQVPELRVQNGLDTPVLLLDGEELVGAKQNRVVNLTILLPARAELVIPVSCVESGRWRHVAPDFSASGRAQFREGRAHKQAQVSLSLAMCATPVADQGDVWARISDRASRLGVHAPTSAMHDLYESQRHHVDEFVRALEPVDAQVGAAFAINGRLAGAELFDAPETLRRLLAKIVGSYALDAVVTPQTDGMPPFEPGTVRAWLSRLAAVAPTAHPSVGLGVALRWSGPGLTAAALALHDELVHFVGFPLDERSGHGSNGSRMRAASWRRGQRTE